MAGVGAEFTVFQQGDQNGSGAQGSADDINMVGGAGSTENRAQSAMPGGCRGREETERDTTRRRVPVSSPRAAPYVPEAHQGATGVTMEQMFQQFLTTVLQATRQQGSRAEAAGSPGRATFGDRVMLDEKHFKRVDKFSGGRKKEDIDYKT